MGLSLLGRPAELEGRKALALPLRFVGGAVYLGPLRVGPATRDELLGKPVDEVGAVHVPADVEADERHAPPTLDRDDLTEQDRGVLREVVARLARDGHVEGAEVSL